MGSLSSQVEMMTLMDDDLYKAAVNGEIEAFSNYEGHLDCLLTPNKNTVLHVYLANSRFRSGGWSLKFISWYFQLNMLSNFPFGRWFSPLMRWSFPLMGWSSPLMSRSDKFVRHVLDKCPSLLLKANERGEIPLHIEARFGDLPITELLIQRANEADLENGIEPAKQMLRATDKEENMALHIASKCRNLAMAQRLIQEDPDFVYPANKSGETPLFLSASRGYHSMVSEILVNSKSVDHGGPNGTNALHAAVMAKCERTTKVILEEKRHLAKEVDEDDRTPLHYAAHLGLTSIVKLLLESDKWPASKMDNQKMTPLLVAARQGYEQTMMEIIKQCPNCCELTDGRGWNFLHFAVVSLSLGSLQRFLQAPKFRNLIDEKDIHGNTPLVVLANSDIRPLWISETISYRRGPFIPRGLINSKKQEEILKVLEDIGQGEVGGAPVRPLRKYKLDFSRLDKACENQALLAALVVTITFAAVFQVPGGYNSGKGQDQGTAILSRNLSFAAFIISDAVALICSLSSLAVHTMSSQPFICKAIHSYNKARLLLAYSITALVVAFVTGTYAVLQPSRALATVVCVIALSSIPGFVLLSYKIKEDMTRDRNTICLEI